MSGWGTPNGKVTPPVEMHSSRGITRTSHHAALGSASLLFGVKSCLLSFGGFYARAVFRLPIEIHHDEAKNCQNRICCNYLVSDLRSIPRYPNLRANEHYHQKNDCQNNHSFPKVHSRQCQITRIREGWRPNYALPCFWVRSRFVIPRQMN